MSSTASVTKEDVGEVLAQCTCTSLDSALSFLSRKNIIGTVKLPEIKKAAKFLRDRGFNINLYANKAELEEQLFSVFAQLPSRASVNKSAPSQAVSSSAGTTNIPPKPVPPVQMAVPSRTEPAAAPQPKPAQMATTLAPATSSSGQYSASVAARLRDLNSKKRRVFDEAVAIPGMTATEVLDALRFINTADCCVDAVVDSVVMKRSAACDPRDDANIAALERSLYDRAVMESEKERDNIQQRKRQKINDLKNDIQSEVFSYEEFAASVLLRGLPASVTGTLSLSSSASNSSASNSSSSSTSTRVVADHRCLRGSSLVRALVLLFDYVAADSKSLELCELISAPIGGLRVTLVEMLLLERDALKFYKDAGYAYLLSLIHALDGVAEPIFDQAFLNDLFRVGSVKALTSTQWRKLFVGLSSQFEPIGAILTATKESFQRGMVKIPRDGGLIPELFRSKSLIAYVKLLRSNVEADGIEIADEDFGLLSERESVVDDDDDFDDDDDDDY